ncbi:unnamed protein product [Dibothriocephalus latus]|uniref:Uncharacterized protein n=1 Tax=Dibothriocephalus latus TaxID=60516 RepID=A0A3P6T1Y5_DIBLA|nr:unnamed protein product [Dibothriocephalus latus]
MKTSFSKLACENYRRLPWDMPISVKFSTGTLKRRPSRASFFNKEGISLEYVEPTEVCIEAYRSIDSVHFRHNYSEFKNSSYLGIQRLERRRRDLLNTTYFCVNHPSHLHEARSRWKEQYEQEMEEACLRRREKKQTDNYPIKLPEQCFVKRPKRVSATPVPEKVSFPVTPRMMISKSLPSTPRTKISIEKSIERMFVSADRALNKMFATPPPPPAKDVAKSGAFLQQRTALIPPKELLQDLE